jgi:hypothetical protein
MTSITGSCLPGIGEARTILAAQPASFGIESAPAYEPYRRYYLAHQGEMELSVRSLRSHVRQTLSKASATLKQLAALDAALDKILCARERQLLSTATLLLEKRFGQLHRAHQQQLAETPQADDPDAWMQPGGWLASFCKELQGLLLAELDLRLQPTLGLIETFSNERNRHK